MKIWVVDNRGKTKKQSSNWIVRAYDEHTGKTKMLGKFEFHKQAQAFADEKKTELPENLIPHKITFKDAFREYVKSVLADERLVYETRLTKVGAFNNHISPYIKSDMLISDYTYTDFKESYIPTLLKSKQVRVKNKKLSEGGGSTTERIDKTLGKKAIKDVVQEFKMFVKWCRERQWKIALQILNFQFSKNFFQGYEIKDMWVPNKTNVIKILDAEQDPQNKALFYAAAETGSRPNEILGLCYDDVDLLSEIPTISFKHSVDKWNNFRPHQLKTLSSKRVVKISNKLAELLSLWMQQQTFPRKEKGFKLVFGRITKKMSKQRIKAAARKLGLYWERGLSPFRKFSYSLEREQGLLPELVSKKRGGWTMLSRTPDRYYNKDLNNDPRKEQDAINQKLN